MRLSNETKSVPEIYLIMNTWIRLIDTRWDTPAPRLYPMMIKLYPGYILQQIFRGLSLLILNDSTFKNRGMPDSLRCHWNRFLINNVKENVIFLRAADIRKYIFSENTKLKINRFQNYNHEYLIHTGYDKAFKSHFKNGGSLKVMSTQYTPFKCIYK